MWEESVTVWGVCSEPPADMLSSIRGVKWVRGGLGAVIAGHV